MAIDKFFIGPMTSGMEKNLKPFLIPDKAFESLQNAYVFRGRVRKRFGERLMIPTSGSAPGYESLTSRLRILVGVTDINGDITVVIPDGIFKIGGMFSVDVSGVIAELFTITTLANPVINLMTNGASPIHTLDQVAPRTLTITGSIPLSPVFFYQSEPVMGLITSNTANTNDELLVAFDTRFAYSYGPLGWSRLGTGLWSGGYTDFFWGEQYRGVQSSDDMLFVSNFVEADHIKHYSTLTGWATLNPIVNITGGINNLLQTARIIISFKNRLLVFNTKEKAGVAATITYQNRCRFSQNGAPIGDVLAWRDDIPGRGGWIDLPTQETIVTAQHLKDRVIVYCERSTWELVYTGNQVLPFVWQQINTELGAESTFSQVPFDDVVLGVGNVGIHACDGMSVQRIDTLIPNEVFDIHNINSGVDRVAGIRDYFTEQVFWNYPSQSTDSTAPFPDKVLVYNYATKTWAIFDDTITCWGYSQEGNTLRAWIDLNNFTWAEWLDPWNSVAFNSKNRDVVAGNQQGFVFIIDADRTTNAPSMQITGITSPATKFVDMVVINHNLKVGDWVEVDNAEGVLEMNGKVLQVFVVLNANEVRFKFELPTNTDPFFEDGKITGTYVGGGTLTKVSVLDILTKQYNFYMEQGKNLYVSKIDFLVDKTVNGSVAIDFTTSSASDFGMAEEAQATGAAFGVPVLETSPYALVPFEQQQKRLWHPYYLLAEGECVQIRLFYDKYQLLRPRITNSNFELNSMIFYTTPTTRSS